MTDFHTHLLQKIDDGSKSIEETLKMLRISAQKGVSRVIVTPHFSANHWSVEEFIKFRYKRYSQLKEVMTDDLPEIVLGAEVKYYEGISRFNNLKDLCIENTKFLLLEMPVDKWSVFSLRELSEMSFRSDITLVLAHIDRYFGYQSIKTFENLSEQGILMQLNAEAFSSIFVRRKALKMIEKGLVQFIGSDCHDCVKRPPNMDEAIVMIEKKLGKGVIRKLKDVGNTLFNNK